MFIVSTNIKNQLLTMTPQLPLKKLFFVKLYLTVIMLQLFPEVHLWNTAP